jgi:ferredoxin
MSESQAMWHGIPRAQIPWLPTIDEEACIGCSLCFVTCGRGVYEMNGRIASVARGMACMVGCSTCAAVCPTQAISFPDRDLVWRVEREHKIFREVKREADEKQGKLDALRMRAAAEERIASVTSRVRLEIAGEFGQKGFLAQLEKLLEGRPVDLVKLRLEVPSVKGALEKAPSFMSFEVTSTEQEDVQPFLVDLRAVVRENGFVLVNETKF